MRFSTRLGTRGVGFVLMAVAAWGGVVAFVGPTFDFEFGDATRAWVWSQSHALLYVAPGAVGLLGGFLLLATARWALERLGALLALGSGVWFLIGPTVEPLWRNDTARETIGTQGSTTLRVLEGIGYHYGTGAVLVMLAAFALGLLALAPATSAAAAREPETEDTRALRTAA